MNTDDQQDKSYGQIAHDQHYGEYATLLPWQEMDEDARKPWDDLASAVLLAHSQRQSKAAEGGQAGRRLTAQDFLDCFGPALIRTADAYKLADHLNAIIFSTPSSDPEVRWEEFTGEEGNARGYQREGCQVWLNAEDNWVAIGGRGNFITTPHRRYRRIVPAADSGEKPDSNDALKHDLEVVQSQNDALHTEVWALKREHSSLQAQVEALHERVRDEHSENCPFCQRLNNAGGHSQDVPMCGLCQIESHNETLQHDHEEQGAELSAMRSSLELSQREIDSLRTANVRLEKERDQWKEWHENTRVGGQLQAKKIQELQSRLSQQRGALTMSDLEEAQEAVGWDAKGMADFLNQRIYVTRGGLTAGQVQQAIFAFYEEPDLKDCEKIAGILNQHLLSVWTPCAPGSMPTEADGDRNGKIICLFPADLSTRVADVHWAHAPSTKAIAWTSFASLGLLPAPTPVAAREDDGECYKAWSKAIQNDLDGTAPLKQWTMAWEAALVSTKEGAGS